MLRADPGARLGPMHPLLPIPLLWLAGAAHAAESPVARCAQAAEGTEVEVCLQLAIEHPEERDGIAAALRAHIARKGSGDQDLLLALLSLIDDETARSAADRIRELADPRGISALVACAERREIEVAEACVSALSAFDRGTEHLARWLISERQPLELRLAAARTLGEVGSEDAANALIDALRRPRLPASLRRAILESIRTHYPDRVAELEGQVASDGRLWLTAGGAWGLGFALGSAGYFGQSRLAPVGWVTGAVGGGTAGWLYGRAWPMEAGDAAYITTGGILGTTSGMFLGASIDPTNPDRMYMGGLGGMAVGYGVTAATRTQHPGTPGDALEASGIAALTSTGAVSATSFALSNGSPVGTERASARLLATGLGLGLGSVGGHLIAPQVDLTPEDAGLIALSSAWGLGATWLVPIGESDRSTLPLLGASAGGLIGYGLAAPLDVPVDVQAASWAGGVYGGVLGLGLGLTIDPASDAPRAMAMGLGTAGMLTGAGFAVLDPEPLDDRDVVLVGLSTAWATWQSAGWALVLHADTRQVGPFVMFPAVVGAGMAIASPVVDVSVPQSSAATSVGLWGAYTGGVAAELTDNDVLLWALVGGDLGLAGGAVLMSPVVGAQPVVIGVADAGGVLGGSVGALGAAFATEDPDAILAASLVGAGVGFGTGAVVGATWKRGGTRDQARRPWKLPGRWLVRPDMGTDHTGLAVQVTEW